MLASLCAPVILLVDRRCDKFSTDPEDQNAMAYHDYYLDDYPGYGSDIAKAMMVRLQCSPSTPKMTEEKSATTSTTTSTSATERERRL